MSGNAAPRNHGGDAFADVGPHVPSDEDDGDAAARATAGPLDDVKVTHVGLAIIEIACAPAHVASAGGSDAPSQRPTIVVRRAVPYLPGLVAHHRDGTRSVTSVAPVPAAEQQGSAYAVAYACSDGPCFVARRFPRSTKSGVWRCSAARWQLGWGPTNRRRHFRNKDRCRGDAGEGVLPVHDNPLELGILGS